MRKHDVRFGNVVIRFGEHELLDRLDEIVIPAILNDTIVRSYGSTTFHFHETSVEELKFQGENERFIIGRFVKRAVLKREQTFNPSTGDLVEDEDSLETAPSAFFVFRLMDHKLIYFAETSHAPDMNTLQASLRNNLTKVWKQYIDAEYERAGQFEGRKVTKTSLMQLTPKPSVTVTPVSGGSELSEFIARFSEIKSLSITVLERNQEVDPNGMVEAIEKTRQKVGGKKATLVTSAPEGNGLDPTETEELMTVLGKTGNQELKLVGKDLEGERLVGDQSDFSVIDRLATVPSTAVALANSLLKKLSNAVDNKLIKISAFKADQDMKIRRALGDDET